LQISHINVSIQIFTRAAWYNGDYSTDLDCDRDTCTAILNVHYEYFIITQAA